MRIVKNRGYSYDDVLVRPVYSTIDSRSEIDLSTKFTKRYNLRVPITSAPMDTVTSYPMAQALAWFGGAGVLHRFCTVQEQVSMVAELSTHYPVSACIGVTEGYRERAEALVRAGAIVLVIDVAHADHQLVYNALYDLKTDSGFHHVDIMVGNIATREAAKWICDMGADGIKVGIGPGSVCSTRIEAGVGVPQLSAVMEVVKVARSYKVPVCADGGIRFSGDIVKALIAGADSVMLGSLLAATDEAPGETLLLGFGNNQKRMKEYRGSASHNSKLSDGRKDEYIEGMAHILPHKGPAKKILTQLEEGIQSGFSYVGAMNIKQARKNGEFVLVSPTTNHLPKMGM